MNRLLKKQLCSISQALILSACALSTSSAQTTTVIDLRKPGASETTYLQMQEPARWTQEDVTTAQKYSTATKESNAALYESLKNCQILDVSLRASCTAQARGSYNEEMAAIRIRFGR